MYEQLSTELKASLFQRIKSPFFGSYFFILIILNYRYFLVFISDKDIIEKFKIIDESNFSSFSPINFFNSFQIEAIYLSTFIYPFLGALIYIGIIPYFEYYISMPIWKSHQNRLKEKYANLEKEEVFLGSEKKKYLKEILDLRNEKDNLVEKITLIDLKHKQNTDEIKISLSKEYEEKINQTLLDKELDYKENVQELKDEVVKYKGMTEQFDIGYSNLEKERNDLLKELNKYKTDLDYNETIRDYLSKEIFNNDDIVYLKNYYINSIGNLSYYDLNNKMVNLTKMPLIKIENITNKIINYNYFTKDDYSVSPTLKFKEILLKMFG